MVQVLPYIPGFGERLADTLSNAAGNVAEGYALRRQNRNDQTQYGILNDPNTSAIQKAMAVSKLSEGRKKHASPIFASVLGEHAKAQEERNQFNDIFQGQQGQQLVANQSPMQNLMSAISPQQQQGQQLPNSQAQQQAQLIQNPSGNPQQNPQAQSNQIIGGQPAPQMNRNDPTTWDDNTLNRVAALNGPIGKSAQSEQNRRKQDRKEQFQREQQEQGITQRAEEQTKHQIGKENRAAINKYSEPYEDLTKLQAGVTKLEKAQELIRSKRVSVDDNWLRNATSAILEGHDTPLSEFVKTDEQQQLWYLLRDALKPKEIGGSNPSTKEVLIAMSSIPNPYKGQKANEFIIRNMINDAKVNLKKGKLVHQAKNEKISDPSQFKDRVEQGALSYQNKLKDKEIRQQITNNPPAPGYVWMLDPTSGVPKQVPQNMVDKAISAGGKLL